jgi:hypothetical protein
VILRRTPVRVVVDLVGEVSSSWLGWRKRQRREVAPGVSEDRNERGRGRRRGGGIGGTRYGAWRSFSAPATRTHKVSQTVREGVRSVRPFRTETSFLSLNSKLDLPNLQKL